MKMRILGCDGGRGIGYNTTSLLFNDHILIDAGSVLPHLTLDEAAKITDIFLTHSHLDHLADLPFLMDNTFGMRDKPIRIHAQQCTLDDLMNHIFNNRVWPDFSKLPTADNGQFVLCPLQAEETVTVDGLSFTPIQVNHLIPTFGFKVSDANASFIFSGDTGPTERLWEIANATENLKAVVMDLSFPNDMQAIATLSYHLSSHDLENELKKLTRNCDVYLFHFKPSAQGTLRGEVTHLTHFGRPLQALRDYEVITF